jgi:hypothetical protein
MLWTPRLTSGRVETLLMLRPANKTGQGRPMTFEEMEFALWRIDVMLGLLKRSVERGTDPQAAEDMTRLQQWRDDLDVQIGLERIKRGTQSPPRRPSLHS